MRLNRSSSLVIALVISLCGMAMSWFLWPNAPLRAADTREYLEAAQDLADGGFSQVHERTPGFPLMLVLTGSAESPTRLLFFVLLLLHTASVAMIATRLSYAPWWAPATVAIVMWLPPFVSPSVYAMTETPTEFCLVLGFVSLCWYGDRRHTGWLILAALAVTGAAFIRPTNLLLWLPVAAWMAVYRFPKSAVASMVAVPVTALLAFSYFNYAQFGYFGATPKLGFSLSTRTVRFLERIPDSEAPVREALIRARDESLTRPNSSHTGVQYIWGGVIDEVRAIKQMSRLEASRYMLRLNLRLIAAAPLDYLNEVARATVGYWFPHTDNAAIFGSRVVQLAWTALEFLVVGLFLMQAIVICGSVVFLTLVRGAGAVAKELPALPSFAYGLAMIVIVYTMAVSSAAEVGDPRYRIPTDALLLFAIASGLVALWDAARNAKTTTISRTTTIRESATVYEWQS